MRIDSDFPGGNVLVLDLVEDVVRLEPDIRDTQEPWFYWHFRVRQAAGRTLRFEGLPLGANGPAVSADEGVSWRWLGKATVKDNSFNYTFDPDVESIRFAVGMSYVQADWERFLARIRAAERTDLRLGELCRSRKGRAVEMLYAGCLDGLARFRVVVTSRHHACEMMANYAMEGMIDTILADNDTGRLLRERIGFLFVPFVDKDGVEDGDQGKSRRPRDHGQDYDAQALYPETRALYRLLSDWCDGKRLAMALDLHCPWLYGEWNEHIYQVGSRTACGWARQQRLARILEGLRVGPLPYLAADDLPFGTAWNNRPVSPAITPFTRWAATLPGMDLASTFEIPYANASGVEVNPENARSFGRDLAAAVCRYLIE